MDCPANGNSTPNSAVQGVQGGVGAVQSGAVQSGGVGAVQSGAVGVQAGLVEEGKEQSGPLSHLPIVISLSSEFQPYSSSNGRDMDISKIQDGRYVSKLAASKYIWEK